MIVPSNSNLKAIEIVAESLVSFTAFGRSRFYDRSGVIFDFLTNLWTILEFTVLNANLIMCTLRCECQSTLVWIQLLICWAQKAVCMLIVVAIIPIIECNSIIVIAATIMWCISRGEDVTNSIHLIVRIFVPGICFFCS